MSNISSRSKTRTLTVGSLLLFTGLEAPVELSKLFSQVLDEAELKSRVDGLEE